MTAFVPNPLCIFIHKEKKIKTRKIRNVSIMIIEPLLMGSSSAIPRTVLIKSVKICFTPLFKQFKQFFQVMWSKRWNRFNCGRSLIYSNSARISCLAAKAKSSSFNLSPAMTCLNASRAFFFSPETKN